MLANLSSDLNSTMRSSKSISAASATLKAEQFLVFFFVAAVQQLTPWQGSLKATCLPTLTAPVEQEGRYTHKGLGLTLVQK